MRIAARVAVCTVFVLVTCGALFAAQPMELLAALEQGKVQAEFYGNGDQSVHGRIRPAAFGPDQIYVAPGTQFWAQQPGLQGMTTLGWVPIDLRNRPFVFVEIPTACTNYGLPAPSRWDRMIPYCCPSERMAALCDTVGRVRPSREVAQLAVWAIANNPEWEQIRGFAEARAKGDDDPERKAAALVMRRQAAELLAAAGVNLGGMAMFAELVEPEEPAAQE